jgi:hypothetical protein
MASATICWSDRLRRIGLAAGTAVALVAVSHDAVADEGGVGFWLPGLYGSLAATPLEPGWSFGSVFIHNPVTAQGDIAAAREVTINNIPRHINVDLNLRLAARADIEIFSATYVFATKVLGGQLSVGLAQGYGHSFGELGGTLTVVTNNLTATRSGSIIDQRYGFTDVYPTATLRWNQGVHNFMTYVTGDVPVGTYDSSRLANLGIGHGAVDSGVGYTYFDPKSGNEFSVVTGLTYNFRNPSTDYQNGIDWHLDWGASHFFSQQFHAGLVGYFYQQLTPDIGAPAFLGANEGRTTGIGPQMGYLFPVGDLQGYLNLKGYRDLDVERRAEGWSIWLTFAVSPTAPSTEATKRPMITK